MFLKGMSFFAFIILLLSCRISKGNILELLELYKDIPPVGAARTTCSDYSDSPTECRRANCSFQCSTRSCGPDKSICKAISSNHNPDEEDVCAQFCYDKCNCRRQPYCEYDVAGGNCFQMFPKDGMELPENLFEDWRCIQEGKYYIQSGVPYRALASSGSCEFVEQIRAVNLNGENYTDDRKIWYRADKDVLYLDPNKTRVPGKFDGDYDGPDQDLYSTFVQGSKAAALPDRCLQYVVPLEFAGHYELGLKMADFFKNGTGQRLFTVKLNGMPILLELDLYKVVWVANAPADFVLPFVVNADGYLHPKGYGGIKLTDGRVVLSFCYGGCVRTPDTRYIVSAFHILRIRSLDSNGAPPTEIPPTTEPPSNGSCSLEQYGRPRIAFDQIICLYPGGVCSKNSDDSIRKRELENCTSPTPGPTPGPTGSPTESPTGSPTGSPTDTTESPTGKTGSPTGSPTDTTGTGSQTMPTRPPPTKPTKGPDSDITDEDCKLRDGDICACKKAGCEYNVETNSCRLGKAVCAEIPQNDADCWKAGAFLTYGGIACYGDQTQGNCDITKRIDGVNHDGPNVTDESNILFEEENDSRYIDPFGVRNGEMGVTCRDGTPVGEVQDGEQEIYRNIIFGDPDLKRGRDSICLAYPTKLNEKGRFLLTIKTADLFVEEVNTRIFTIKLNGIPILPNVDLVRLNGPCAATDFLVNFNFSAGDTLTVRGHDPVQLLKDTLYLQFCYGGCEAPQRNFISGGFSIVMLEPVIGPPTEKPTKPTIAPTKGTGGTQEPPTKGTGGTETPSTEEPTKGTEETEGTEAPTEKTGGTDAPTKKTEGTEAPTKGTGEPTGPTEPTGTPPMTSSTTEGYLTTSLSPEPPTPPEGPPPCRSFKDPVECKMHHCEWKLPEGKCVEPPGKCEVRKSKKLTNCTRGSAWYSSGGILCKSHCGEDIGDCTFKKVVIAVNLNGPKHDDSSKIPHVADMPSFYTDTHNTRQPIYIDTYNRSQCKQIIGIASKDKELYSSLIYGKTEKRAKGRCISYHTKIDKDGRYEFGFRTMETYYSEEIANGRKPRQFNIRFNGIIIIPELNILHKVNPCEGMKIVSELSVEKGIITPSGLPAIPKNPKLTIDFCYGHGIGNSSIDPNYIASSFYIVELQPSNNKPPPVTPTPKSKISPKTTATAISTPPRILSTTPRTGKSITGIPPVQRARCGWKNGTDKREVFNYCTCPKGNNCDAFYTGSDDPEISKDGFECIQRVPYCRNMKEFHYNKLFPGDSACRRSRGAYTYGGSICVFSISKYQYAFADKNCTMKRQLLAIRFNGDKFYKDVRNIRYTPMSKKKPDGGNYQLEYKKLPERKPSDNILCHTEDSPENPYKDSDRDLWNMYATGKPGSPPNACFYYYLSIPEDATYELIVKVVDYDFNVVGARSFGVFLNGQEIFIELDPFRVHGDKCSAVDLVAVFDVEGDTLTTRGFPETTIEDRKKVEIKFCKGRACTEQGPGKINEFSGVAFSVIQLQAN